MSAKKFFSVLIAIVVLLVGAGTFMVFARRADDRSLVEKNAEASIPTVTVTHPSVSPAESNLQLPGQLQAYAEAGIYARTTGYLKKWYADLGQHVKAGDLLAEIDTPETDSELMQVKASREQLVAAVAIAKSSADRWAELRKTDSVSQQEADERRATLAQAQASLSAADANIRRLEELASYRKVFAPFSGVITKRNVDTGELVASGTSEQNQLFYLAQTSPLRLFVSVPENSTNAVKKGSTASIEVPQYPGRKFTGRITRTAEVIDPATRTLLVQIELTNSDGALMPGGYAQVHLPLSEATSRVQIPANAVLFRSEGLRAVVIDATNHARLRAIVVGRDFGASLEVLQGLDATDSIVVNPPDALEDGALVHVQTQKPAAKPAVAGGADKK